MVECFPENVRRLYQYVFAVFTTLILTTHTVLARPQTVDSLKTPIGDESTQAAIVRWLYNNFGPVGLVITLIVAAFLIYKVRQRR